jgi:hypothetical protein
MGAFFFQFDQVLEPSFEVADAKNLKTTEKRDPEPQTKAVEKTSMPAQKVSGIPVTTLQQSKTTAPLQSQQHPPSVSNASAQQSKSPPGNKTKNGKSGGGPKTTSPPLAT